MIAREPETEWLALAWTIAVSGPLFVALLWWAAAAPWQTAGISQV